MGYKKMIPFYILKILEEKTDEENGLMLSEITREINKVYGKYTDSGYVVSPTKTQTILDNIEDINRFYRSIYDNYDDAIKTISYGGRNYKKYFLNIRKFDVGDIEFLFNYVANANTLTEDMITDLSTKLLSFLSEKQKEKLIGPKLTDGSTKTRNQSVIYNFEIINKSIANKQNIEFDYYEYNLKKELVKRSRTYVYIVSPYRVITSGGKNYLIGYHIPTESLRTYRIDKIQNIEINKESGYHKADGINPEAFIKDSPYMHTDEKKVSVKLRCKNRILDDLIERFEDCRLTSDQISPDYFIADIPKATYLGMKYWILAFTPDCEVLEPEDLRKEIKETLCTALSRYKK